MRQNIRCISGDQEITLSTDGYTTIPPSLCGKSKRSLKLPANVIKSPVQEHLHATQQNDVLAVCHKLIAVLNLYKQRQPAATHTLFMECICNSLDLHPTYQFLQSLWDETLGFG